jgi:hypothetical protein
MCHVDFLSEVAISGYVKNREDKWSVGPLAQGIIQFVGRSNP